MRALVSQLGRFATVGLLATLVHLGVAWVAVRGLDVSPLTANAMGFVVAFVVSYMGHFFWTFGQRSGHPVRLPRFLIVSGISLLLTSGITWTTERAGLPFEAALFAILLTVPLTTWALSRFWAFRA